MNRILSLLLILCAVLFVPLPSCAHKKPAQTGPLSSGYLTGQALHWSNDNGGTLELLGGSGDPDASTPVVRDISGDNPSLYMQQQPSDGGLILEKIKEWKLADGSVPPGHMFCQKQGTMHGKVYTPGEAVDMGELPSEPAPEYSEGFGDKRLMRGIPLWQWNARCYLWIAGDYKWPADAGVIP